MKFAVFLLYAIYHSSCRLLIVSQASKDFQGDVFVARILVVDDDKTIRLLLRAVLERQDTLWLRPKTALRDYSAIGLRQLIW